MGNEFANNQSYDLGLVSRNAPRASAILKAMSNRHRLLILCQLVNGEKSVGQLEEFIGLSQSALSQHLARLRQQDLVKTRRQAQTIFYSLDGDEATSIIKALYVICTTADEKDTGDQDEQAAFG
ncbi:MAG: metalloregulator ArsR/SmtB family transcription factor [Proteobacteria bacterium]|nr:metalloregulator ArsR/SmtB family transcription factor [Pseudomonadota bacterium]MDA1021845.1 metalloregulator ArsR/SmtB family transcription factor [Pseudomonadota bacterium]